MKPRAFVVMPFNVKEVLAASPPDAGQGDTPNTAIRVNFDQVYEKLIKPALRNAGCDAFRADEEPGAGNILLPVYDSWLFTTAESGDLETLARRQRNDWSGNRYTPGRTGRPAQRTDR